MFAAAIIAGAIGGFAFELMPVHSECHMGSIQTPHRLKGGHAFNLGFLSNLLLGAVTSVAVLYFFPPETQTIIKDTSGGSQTMYSYDLVKLIALSLIVGSAGPSFLSSIQGRLAGALNAQKETFARKTQEELDKVHESAGTTVTTVAQEKKRQVEEVLTPLRETAMKMHHPTMAVVAGNGSGKASLGYDRTVEDMANYVDNVISMVHTICDSAEAEVKRQLDEVVGDAKKAISREMGMD